MDAGGAIVHRATTLGGRMPPVLRNPLAARRAALKSNGHCTDLHGSSRQDAGVELATSGLMGRAAGRGVDAQAERGHRGRPGEGVSTSGLREPGTEARLQQAAGRGVDAQVEHGHRCHPREGVSTSELREPGKDARLQYVHRATI